MSESETYKSLAALTVERGTTEPGRLSSPLGEPEGRFSAPEDGTKASERSFSGVYRIYPTRNLSERITENY